jgi:hypothetical protein
LVAANYDFISVVSHGQCMDGKKEAGKSC